LLAGLGNEFVYFYHILESNGEILLLILNYNGLELARKIFSPQPTNWYEAVKPKKWIGPLPQHPDDINLQPAHRFLSEISFQDFENPFTLAPE